MRVPTGLTQVFRSFAHRNYQLYFSGQLVSLTGTWMQQMALGWLTYRLTNSPMLLGLVGFVSQAPAFLISPFAGILPDKMNRHKLLIATQCLAMLQAGILAWLTLSGHLAIWHIVVLGFFIGVVNAVDMPTRASFVVDMVDNRHDLPNAIALNSSLMNITKLIGPAVAGLLIFWVGEGMCFLLNAVSYVAVIIALLMMKIRPKPKRTIEKFSMMYHLKEGYAYAFGFEPIRILLLITAVTSIAGMSYMVLMPVYVRQVFHGNATTLGLLMTASGAGSVIGTLLLASRESVVGLGKWICGAMILFSIAQAFLAFSHNIALSVALLVLVGFGLMIQMASTNTILQTLVEEDKRGRVMSMYAMSFMGIMPIGSLLAGALANKLGVSWTILIGALICLVLALWTFKLLPGLREKVRPVYVAKGIIK